jgi:hypothetical protein
VLIRLIAVVAGLLVVLLVIRYTLAADYTECDRTDCGVGWDILYGAWRAAGILFLALVACWLGRLGWRTWGHRGG